LHLVKCTSTIVENSPSRKPCGGVRQKKKELLSPSEKGMKTKKTPDITQGGNSNDRAIMSNYDIRDFTVPVVLKLVFVLVAAEIFL